MFLHDSLRMHGEPRLGVYPPVTTGPAIPRSSDAAPMPVPLSTEELLAGLRVEALLELPSYESALGRALALGADTLGRPCWRREAFRGWRTRLPYPSVPAMGAFEARLDIPG